MTLLKVNPRSRKHRMPSIFDEFFNTAFGDHFTDNSVVRSRPLINVSETDESFHLELAAPGLSKEDFQVSIDKDLLTISVEKERSEGETTTKYSRREFSFESFKRSFHLPESVDSTAIGASYENGVLLLTLPKREEAKEQPARTIEIS